MFPDAGLIAWAHVTDRYFALQDELLARAARSRVASGLRATPAGGWRLPAGGGWSSCRAVALREKASGPPEGGTTVLSIRSVRL